MSKTTYSDLSTRTLKLSAMGVLPSRKHPDFICQVRTGAAQHSPSIPHPSLTPAGTHGT